MAGFEEYEVHIIDGDVEIDTGASVRSITSASYLALRNEIEQDEIVDFFFDFVTAKGHVVREKQENRWEVCDKIVRIKRKASFDSACCEKRPCHAADRNTTSSSNAQVDQEIKEIEEDINTQRRSKHLDQEILQKWEAEIARIKSKLQDIDRDDEFELYTRDEHEKPIIKVWCIECKSTYGSGSPSSAYETLYNFFRTHIKCETHLKRYLVHHGRKSEVEGQPRLKSHKSEIQNAIEQVINFNNLNKDASYSVVDPTLGNYENKYRVRIKCNHDGKWLPLIPKTGNTKTVMEEHLLSKVHLQALDNPIVQNKSALSGTRGRPIKRVAFDKKQQDLSAFLIAKTTHTEKEIYEEDGDQGMETSNAFEVSLSQTHCTTTASQGLDSLCWGYWKNTVSIRSKEILVKGLLDDQRGGNLWWTEPYTKVTFNSKGLEYNIDGCFRHAHCKRVNQYGEPFEGFCCRFCTSIPNCQDFRMRLYREEKTLVKRGSRNVGNGRRLDLLTNAELRITARTSNILAKKIWREFWWEKRKVAILSIRVRKLREENYECVMRKDVRRFCNNIIEAHRHNRFGGKTALWSFLEDLGKNINRSKEGKRYSKTSATIFEMIKLWGGPRLHQLVSENLGGPSLASTRRIMRKNVLHFIPGEHTYIFEGLSKIYEDCKRRFGITSPVPVLLVEDETVVKRYIRWNAKMDALVGFCGRKDNHSCDSSFTIHVGQGANGFENILNAFQTCCIGHYARVILANPLHEKLPCLVLVVQCTCNRFDGNFVREQWKKIYKIWDTHLKCTLGPIIGHSSDGDSRRRRLMLEDYTRHNEERYGIPWHGWKLNARVFQGNIYGMHDQDFIHNGKKLINGLDSARRRLILGTELVCFNHILLVYNSFSIDEHSLKEGDIKRDDRQNWGAAQRVASIHVQNCLRKLHEGGNGKVERTLGTLAYLEIVSDYVNIYLSQYLNFWERIQKASKVIFFLKLWRSYIQEHDTYSLKDNFISREAYLDVQISCHFSILLMRMFRDQYSDLECPLHLTGSDAAEIFFSKVGGMIGLERAYDFADLMHSAGCLNKVASQECDPNGLKFSRAHKKQEHIWKKLHEDTSKSHFDLKDYSSIQTDALILEALEEGLKDAQVLCQHLGIRAKNSPTWWTSPWSVDDTKLSSQHELSSMDEDENGASIISHEVDEVDDEAMTLSELRHEFDSILDEDKEDIGKPISPLVEMDGKLIYKATLVSQLNGNPSLSKDRLTRVRQGIYLDQKNISELESIRLPLGIGSDCAIFFEHDDTSTRKTRASQSNSRKQATRGTWYLGRVQRMHKKIGNRMIEYRDPIDLLNRPTNLEIQLCWYNKVKGIRTYTYDLTDTVAIDVESVIALANLKYTPSTKNYQLDEADLKVFNNFVNDNRTGGIGHIV